MTQGLLGTIHDAARTPRSNAGWRNVIGDLAERLAAERLGAVRQHTGAGVYCTDLKWGNVDVEVKSCGNSNEVIIYSVRLAKDRWWAQTHTLIYLVVKHCVSIPQPSALEAKLLMCDSLMYAFPFSIVDAVCATMTPKILNRNYKPANGWCQRGYEKGGYLVPLKSLIEAFPHGRLP